MPACPGGQARAALAQAGQATPPLAPMQWGALRDASTGHKFILLLLFVFQFSLLLWIQLGLFLLFFSTFIFFSAITHRCFSFLVNHFLETHYPALTLPHLHLRQVQVSVATRSTPSEFQITARSDLSQRLIQIGQDIFHGFNTS